MQVKMELHWLGGWAETYEASSVCEHAVFHGLGADLFLFSKKGL